MDTTVKLLRGMPPRLKGKIASAAVHRATSLNALIVETLAAHYGIEYVGPDRPSGREVGANPNLQLRMPTALSDEIDADADRSGESKRNTMIRILSERFNVPFVPTSRWPSRSAA